MFAFLSGVGLWQSLERNNDTICFYKKRVRRVVLPYLLISAVFYLYFYMEIHKSIVQFIADLSLVSYWMQGRGAWFVAWIIPVYLIYPLYAKIAHKHSWISLIVAASIILVISISGIPKRFESAAGATIAFFIGDFMARYIKEDRKWCLLAMGVLVFTAPVYMLGIIRSQSMYISLFAGVGMSLCSIFTVLLRCVPNVLRRILQRIGQVSLECYLMNVYLITVARHLFSAQINTGFGFVIYLMVSILGIYLSLLIGKMRKRVRST